MDGVTRLWAMRRSKWDGADGGFVRKTRMRGMGSAFTDGARLGWGGVGTEPRRLVLAAGLGGRRA